MASSVIKKPLKFGTVTDITSDIDGSGWTAPSDGIMTIKIRIAWAGTFTGGYYYIDDNTIAPDADTKQMCFVAYSTGYASSYSFPVIQGHTYKKASSGGQALTQKVIKFYPLTY